ncbi:MAG: hypothetical protein J07HQX50_01754, partial [Haloquadratum sp. J07HQX50]
MDSKYCVTPVAHETMTEPQKTFDDEVPEDRCGYTFPEDSAVERDPRFVSQQGSCIRDPLSDSDRCAFHAGPDETEHKLQQLRNTGPVGDSLDGAILPGQFADSVEFADISLLRDADLSEAHLEDDNLSEVHLSDADLSGAYLRKANLSKADLRDADLSEAILFDADLSEAHLPRADLSEAYPHRANLSETVLRSADLSGADLSDVDLSEAHLEQATLVEVNLFDAELTKVTPYGARIEAVQINDGTEFYGETKEYSRWWQRATSLLAAPPRCGYDPALEQPEQATGKDREALLTRAADTYR